MSEKKTRSHAYCFLHDYRLERDFLPKTRSRPTERFTLGSPGLSAIREPTKGQPGIV